ncbi:hypothetical protein [Vibrio renipiscarius]|uniref:Adhesin n=1 Tax=Vibrio renipiscarius TaxID=1461322 RepID=A0A0C2NRN9_9VIBR|nr:hypothetical protein [Vibrio renipiscarius]KII75402.1 hypothetical protein OJ16_19160 [Vibrio renipiscarius]KII78855.1 hypothetical protein PL18_11270 [Vibrio renipiscarius]
MKKLLLASLVSSMSYASVDSSVISVPFTATGHVDIICQIVSTGEQDLELVLKDETPSNLQTLRVASNANKPIKVSASITDNTLRNLDGSVVDNADIKIVTTGDVEQLDMENDGSGNYSLPIYARAKDVNNSYISGEVQAQGILTVVCGE